jgi:uncharacterized membrane protein YfcA
MHLTAESATLLAAVAFLAAAVNAVAGGGALLSFPTLLLLGVPALAANVSNTVGSLTGYAGGTLAYRGALSGQRNRIAVLGAVSAAGAGVGAALLLTVARGSFEGAVPWLILASCALIAAQPLAASRLTAHREPGRQYRAPLLLAGQFLAGAYGAFFGGGLSVLTLALIGLFVRDDLQRLNALKGVLSGIINAVAAVSFALFAPVVWAAVGIMLPAGLLGGFAGVAVARRLNGSVLRVIVVAVGLAVAIRMLIPSH